MYNYEQIAVRSPMLLYVSHFPFYQQANNKKNGYFVIVMFNVADSCWYQIEIVTEERRNMKHWVDLYCYGKSEVQKEHCIPVPPFLSQIPHRLAGVWTPYHIGPKSVCFNTTHGNQLTLSVESNDWTFCEWCIQERMEWSCRSLIWGYSPQFEWNQGKLRNISG